MGRDSRKIEELLLAVALLDPLMERATRRAQRILGPEATRDAFRGLYIDAYDVDRCVRPAFATLRDAADPPLLDPSGVSPPFALLQDLFELTKFDQYVLLLALAPEIDLRYERLFGYLQDDVTRRRATMDLALSLLCSSVPEKLRRRSRFGQAAPLFRHHLVRLVAEPTHAAAPMHAHSLHPDEQIVRHLVGPDDLGPRLASFCRLRAAATEDLLPANRAQLRRLQAIYRAAEDEQRLAVELISPSSDDMDLAGAALAGMVGRQLLVADVSRAATDASAFEEDCAVFFREARLRNAVAYVSGFAKLEDERKFRLSRTLARFPGIAVLAGPLSIVDPGETRLRLRLDRPGYSERRALWRGRLAANSLEACERDIDAVAGRYRLRPAQIDQATKEVRSERDGHARNGTVDSHQLFRAACSQGGRGLESLARRIRPRRSWEDLVLPDGPARQLGEVCKYARFHHIVFDEWGFDAKYSVGKGLTVLLTGPPGTGKTLAAEVIGHDLGLDVFKIDLSRIVNKYIGETEKNLDKVFSASEDCNAILLFDEADALFGKRSEVRDSHDRYANVEVSYLLQKMDEHEGIALLSTNARSHMDVAFVRRLRFCIDFPFPDAEGRARIWKAHLPARAPLAHEIEYKSLGDRFALAGGNIQNAVLAASFLAAAEASSIGLSHLVRGAHRELEKLGLSRPGNLTDADSDPLTTIEDRR